MFGSVFPSIDNTGKDDLILAVGPRPSSDLMRTTEKTWYHKILKFECCFWLVWDLFDLVKWPNCHIGSVFASTTSEFHMWKWVNVWGLWCLGGPFNKRLWINFWQRRQINSFQSPRASKTSDEPLQHWTTLATGHHLMMIRTLCITYITYYYIYYS